MPQTELTTNTKTYYASQISIVESLIEGELLTGAHDRLIAGVERYMLDTNSIPVRNRRPVFEPVLGRFQEKLTMWVWYAVEDRDKIVMRNVIVPRTTNMYRLARINNNWWNDFASIGGTSGSRRRGASAEARERRRDGTRLPAPNEGPYTWTYDANADYTGFFDVGQDSFTVATLGDAPISETVGE